MQQKKVSSGKLVLLILSIFSTLAITFLMRILGGYSYATIILTLFLAWFFIGFIVFMFAYFLKKKQASIEKDFQLTPDVARQVAYDKMIKEDGVVRGEKILDTVRAVGEDGQEKDPYLLMVFRDAQVYERIIAYARNLKKLDIEYYQISKENEDVEKFMKQIEQEIKATATPKKDQGTYIERRYDPGTGELISEKQGTVLPPLPMFQQPQEKKGEVEIVNE